MEPIRDRQANPNEKRDFNLNKILVYFYAPIQLQFPSSLSFGKGFRKTAIGYKKIK